MSHGTRAAQGRQQSPRAGNPAAIGQAAPGNGERTQPGGARPLHGLAGQGSYPCLGAAVVPRSPRHAHLDMKKAAL